MKIHKIWAENVRGISNRVTVELSPTGFNLITARNEMGKTTIAQVLNYIFQWPSKSTAGEIQNLKPYGKDVSPLMGTVIEVNGQIYKIEKQWLRSDYKTEVELISPEKSAHSGPAAEKLVNEIYTKHLDDTVWKMIQIAQGEFAGLLTKKNGNSQKDILRNILGRAVSNGPDGSDESLAKKTFDEYLKWWTAKTGKIATAEGTSGKLISDLTVELGDLEKTALDLATKISKASDMKNQMTQNRDSHEILKRRKEAQDTKMALEVVISQLTLHCDAKKDIEDFLLANTSIKNFSVYNFANLTNDHSAYEQYSALKSIKVTALGDGVLEINGESLSLLTGESIDQKLESPMNITIPNLLSIDYVESGKEGAEKLGAAADRYLKTLKDLGCESYEEAKEISGIHDVYQQKLSDLATLERISNYQSLTEEFSRCELVKGSLPDWDTDISAPPVTTDDLEESKKRVYQEEVRIEDISRYGWHSDLLETQERISDCKKHHEGLEKSANAARMLYNVLTEHKESAEKDYSVHFAKYINYLAKSFYGADVSFKVSDSFEIVSRRLNGVEVVTADLSIGAKEQLAILIRLALTQIVQLGEPFPVILDDEFAHSDAERIAMMNNVFKDFGDEQQFIMLTCYPDKFSGYRPAKTIDLEALRGV